MMHFFKAGVLAGALALGSAASAAITITPVAGNLQSFSYSVVGSVITIRETWGPATGRFVYLEFDGLRLGVDYTVRKFATNSTGFAWGSFSHELGFGSGAGFTGSDDLDGLSFAQNSLIPRTSDRFSSVVVDELATRDYLNFVNGYVPDGDTVAFSYGLRARFADNQPFTLRQGVIPEPATWAMMIMGFGLIGAALRRRTAVATA